MYLPIYCHIAAATKQFTITQAARLQLFSPGYCGRRSLIRQSPEKDTMENFLGRWKFKSSENVDALIDTFDISADIKKRLRNFAKSIDVTQSGDEWVWAYLSEDSDKTEFRFKLDKEFEHISLSGGVCKITVSIVDGKMMEKQRVRDNNIDIVRELINGELVVTVTTKGVTALTYYTRA